MPRPRDAEADPATLRRCIERALDREEAPNDVVPMLERLQKIAGDGTDERAFADRRLAELLLERAPWRAATLIRRVLARTPDDDAPWALMGLAQALLGNHRSAVAAYRSALAIDPKNPWYSHNLGHILDIALDRPREAVRHLEVANARLGDESAIACSFAHALHRAGDDERARKILQPFVRRGARDPDVAALAAILSSPKPARAAPAKAPTRAAAFADAHGEEVRRAASLLTSRGLVRSPRSSHRRARALLADFARSQSLRVADASDAAERTVVAGAALLALARVDGLARLPFVATAAALGVPAADLRARVRAVVSSLAIVSGDPRYLDARS